MDFFAWRTWAFDGLNNRSIFKFKSLSKAAILLISRSQIELVNWSIRGGHIIDGTDSCNNRIQMPFQKPKE